MTPKRRLLHSSLFVAFDKKLEANHTAHELASHLSSNTYNTNQSDFAYG